MRNMKDSWQELLLRTLWYGGSTFDAWLNIAAGKMSNRLLTIPQATEQLGLPSAVVVALFQVSIAVWSQCMINILYLKHKANNANSDVSRKNTIQLHEVIGGVLGSRWKVVSLLFNLTALFSASFVQLIACSNVVYVLNDNLYKRTWTSIFSAIFSLSILIPSAHNYRVWSFIGVTTILFVSGYLTFATLLHGKEPNAKYSSPHSYEEYFSGLGGLVTLGHIMIPVEIMDAMWEPQKYKVAYSYGALFILFVAMVPSITMDINFGDELLKKVNGLVLLPDSVFRKTAIILILVHQFINFGLYSLPVYIMWEKLLGVHNSPRYIVRTLSRIPVFLAFWLMALAFPFYGVINRVFDVTLNTWNLYIIPCAAYIAVFFSREKQRGLRSFSRLGWAVDFSVNLAIILWVILECGFGLWANVVGFLKLEGLHVFAKCYSC